jgi:catechol 2,3-dioxygenase-like lactoylglutathione lyase family enzyme
MREEYDACVIFAPMSSQRPAGLRGKRPPEEGNVSTTQTRIAKIGVVCVPVTDQDRAFEFYSDVLGFEKRADVPFGNGDRWLEVAPPGADTTIAIVKPPPGNPTGGTQTGIGLQTTDIDALHTDLKARGIDVDDEVSRMGGPVPPLLWFRDPDANILMVVEVPES